MIANKAERVRQATGRFFFVSYSLCHSIYPILLVLYSSVSLSSTLERRRNKSRLQYKQYEDMKAQPICKLYHSLALSLSLDDFVVSRKTNFENGAELKLTCNIHIDDIENKLLHFFLRSHFVYVFSLFFLLHIFFIHLHWAAVANAKVAWWNEYYEFESLICWKHYKRELFKTNANHIYSC